MRKFIVSDLHGNGKIYDSIISYLDDINKNEEVILYINGDLIDRGPDSARLLLDVKDRIENNKGFKIVYLGGNHELMMYQAFKERFNGIWRRDSDWFYNGAEYTLYGLTEMLTKDGEENIINFISNLKLYHKFDEKLNGKPIVLVHAKCPKIVKDECDMFIKDNNIDTSLTVWTRREDYWTMLTNNLGNEDYFTIIGHTPVNDHKGYEYYKSDNTLNIDGGCAKYACGLTDFDHTPLVEIDDKNDRLIILTFNSNNKIVCGNYFTNGISAEIKSKELDSYRKILKKVLKK